MFKDLVETIVHDHNYLPTGKESLRGINMWYLEKFEITECNICGKTAEKHISYIKT